MTTETQCLRCGNANLVAATLEQPVTFCVDHDSHHGRLKLGLRALLCRDCGHVEFQAPEPGQIAAPGPTASGSVIQEEDF